EENVRTRALTYALVIPAAQFFTHLTAALLWELPLPPAVIRCASLAPDVGVMNPGRAPRSRRVRPHEVRPGGAHVVTHPTHHVRLTSPASTWAMLGGLLP